jgi:hypothetical protein
MEESLRFARLFDHSMLRPSATRADLLAFARPPSLRQPA